MSGQLVSNVQAICADRVRVLAPEEQPGQVRVHRHEHADNRRDGDRDHAGALERLLGAGPARRRIRIDMANRDMGVGAEALPERRSSSAGSEPAGTSLPMSSSMPGEPDLNRRLRPRHRLAHLGHRQPGDVAQRQQGAVLGVQPREGSSSARRRPGGPLRVRPEDRSGDRRARAWSHRGHPGVSPGPSPRRQRASTATRRGPRASACGAGRSRRRTRRPRLRRPQPRSRPAMTKATRVMSSLCSRTRRAKAAVSPSAARRTSSSGESWAAAGREPVMPPCSSRAEPWIAC